MQNILSAIFPTYQHMTNHFPASANLDTKQFIGWVLFNIMMIPILYVRPEGMKNVVLWMNVVSAITLICIMIWTLSTAHGGGPLLSAPATVTSSADLGWAIVHGVTTVIGGIAVGLSNQMDYSRFAHRPGDQVMGQWISIMGFGVVFPLFGCLTSSATQGIYGEVSKQLFDMNSGFVLSVTGDLEPAKPRPEMARHRLQCKVKSSGFLRRRWLGRMSIGDQHY